MPKTESNFARFVTPNGRYIVLLMEDGCDGYDIWYLDLIGLVNNG